MPIPPKSDPRWRNALLGIEPQFRSLATILVVTRLRDAVSRDEAQIPASIAELHEFFVSNSFATVDLSAI